MKWFLLKKLFGLNVLTDRMKTSSQSPAAGSTASHQGGESAAPFFSTLRNRLFVLFPSHQIDKNTCKYFCCIFASIKFISYWSSKVFDIISCMQKAHWYCEWITVYVIDSFIIIFFSFCYFWCLLSPNFTALPVASSVCAQTDSVWLSCVQYFCPVCRKSFVFSFLFWTSVISQWSSEIVASWK